MTGVLVVDDHPALREGLVGLLAHEPGLSPLGAVAGDRGLDAVLAEQRPDVVILDYALQDGDGLSVCFRLKQRRPAPGVVLYSAYVDDVFAVPATLAMADALVSKTAPVEDLLGAVRAVGAGRRCMPDLLPDAMAAASARLPAADLPIAGMLFSGVAVDDIAQTLDVSPRDVRRRALRMIGRLQSVDRIAAFEPAETLVGHP